MRADIEFGTFVVNTTFCGGRARSETKGLYSQVNKLNKYDTKLRTFLIFFLVYFYVVSLSRLMVCVEFMSGEQRGETDVFACRLEFLRSWEIIWMLGFLAVKSQTPSRIR